MAAFSISACNSKPKEKPEPKELPFVTQTEKNLREWIDKNAINPEDFKVSNYKVVWKTDSLCVINVKCWTFSLTLFARVRHLPYLCNCKHRSGDLMLVYIYK